MGVGSDWMLSESVAILGESYLQRGQARMRIEHSQWKSINHSKVLVILWVSQ